jgi:hypothetical protein
MLKAFLATMIAWNIFKSGRVVIRCSAGIRLPRLASSARRDHPNWAEAALEAAARALQVRPNWWTSLEVLVYYYAFLEKWDEARRCAREMAKVTTPATSWRL